MIKKLPEPKQKTPYVNYFILIESLFLWHKRKVQIKKPF